eukprot:3387156-Prymnesium_polylepis.1
MHNPHSPAARPADATRRAAGWRHQCLRVNVGTPTGGLRVGVCTPGWGVYTAYLGMSGHCPSSFSGQIQTSPD